jgi:C-terminal processing protease CtpA/Prc
VVCVVCSDFCHALISPRSRTLAGSAAYAAGLRSNDRILEVNGHDAQGASHASVVDWVVAGGQKLNMRVLRISDSEALRLKRIEEMADDADGKPKTKVYLRVRGVQVVSQSREG